MPVAEIEDEFALEVYVVTDIPAGDGSRGCTTNDGCDPTCASSCVSSGL